MVICCHYARFASVNAVMDKFSLFLWKILKEYKFSWIFKLSFLVLIPIALICTYLKISHVQEVKNIEFDPLDAVCRWIIIRRFNLI